jgi:hypothetical protein
LDLCQEVLDDVSTNNAISRGKERENTESRRFVAFIDMGLPFAPIIFHGDLFRWPESGLMFFVESPDFGMSCTRHNEPMPWFL